MVTEKKAIQDAKVYSKKLMGELNREFHNWQHIEDMLQALEYYRRASFMPIRDYKDMQLAIIFHDVGLDKGRQGHESRSAEIMAKFLRRRGFSSARIGKIADIIQHSDISVKPENEFHRLMRDLDLVNTGMPWQDFFLRTRNLYSEYYKTGVFKQNEQSWLEFVSKFLRPKFFTEWANSRFGKNRTANMRKILKRVPELQQRHHHQGLEIPASMKLPLKIPGELLSGGIKVPKSMKTHRPLRP